jgi:hypothetical protein
MAGEEKFTWLISSKSFIQLIGAEYDILKKSGSTSVLKFYIAALSIMIILLLSMCSILYAMDLLFHMLHVELLLAIVISILFIFIYIFLLNTFSKHLLNSDGGNKTIPWYQRIKFSDVIRTGFVVFMGFLISKPIEVFFFREKLEKDVRLYKENIMNKYEKKLNELSSKDIQKLQTSISFYQTQLSKHPSNVLMNEVNKLTSQINDINNKQAADLNQADIRIEKSDFLLFRIKKVSKNISAWVICAGMIFLFLLPGFLIYSISSDDDYYRIKKESEEKMIFEEYHSFEIWYSNIFKDLYQLDRGYYTAFEDPPLNTKPKARPSFQSQTDFLNKYSS